MNDRVYFLGDSHSVLSFGQTLLEAFTSQGAHIHFLAFSGLRLRYMTDWKNNPEALTIANFESFPDGTRAFSTDTSTIGQSFHMNDAEILIIALGTNDIVDCAQSGLDYDVDFAPKVEKELSKVSVARIFFIEPPLLGLDRDENVRVKMLKQLSLKGTVIPNGHFRADQNDGIHLKKEMACSYGEFVSKKLLELIFPHH